MSYPTISNNLDVQSFYERLRDKGESHMMADLLAHRQAPGTKDSDKAFLQGTHADHGISGPEWQRRRYIEKARQAGVNISGKRYVSQLADKRGPGDPAAWVADRGEVLDRARMKGHGVEGTKVCPRESAPPQNVKLADDLAQEMMQKEISKNPDLAHKDRRELKAQVTEKYGEKDG